MLTNEIVAKMILNEKKKKKKKIPYKITEIPPKPKNDQNTTET